MLIGTVAPLQQNFSLLKLLLKEMEFKTYTHEGSADALWGGS